MEAWRIAVEDENVRENLRAVCAGLPLVFMDWPENGDPFAETPPPQVVIAGDDTIARLQAKRDSQASLWVTAARGGQATPQSLSEGWADDLLLLPAERLDMVARLRWHNHLVQLRDLERSARAVPDLVAKLEADLLLAEKIQRRLIRDKFPPIQGLGLKSKYWCGLKAGGDYFDVFEYADGQHVGVLLTDCSSYSLSSALLGSLMQLALQGSKEAAPKAEEVVRKIAEKLQPEMKEKDRLSIFFGLLNRRTYELRYVAYGDQWLLQSGKHFTWHLKGDAAEAIHAQTKLSAEPRQLKLDASDRLLLLSDGFREAMGAELDHLAEEKLRPGGEKDLHSLVNDFGYALHKGSGKEMPAQDCSLLLFEVPARALRLAQ